MNKNLVLTMLACLNCVHTTHAVEAIDQPTDFLVPHPDYVQERLEDLKERLKVQNMRILWGIKTNTPNRNAFIRREEILRNVYDASHRQEDDAAYKEMMNIRQGIIKDLRSMEPTAVLSPHTLMKQFKDKIKSSPLIRLGSQDKDRGHGDYTESDLVPDWATSKRLNNLDENVDLIPSLDWVFAQPDETAQRIGRVDRELRALKKRFPEVAGQRRNMYRRMWVHDLNGKIKNQKGWANIAVGLHRLDESNTQTGQELKETILNTLHNNLISEDRYLQERSRALLKQVETVPIMALAKIHKEKKKNKDTIEGHFGEVPNNTVLDHLVKTYL